MLLGTAGFSQRPDAGKTISSPLHPPSEYEASFNILSTASRNACATCSLAACERRSAAGSLASCRANARAYLLLRAPRSVRNFAVLAKRLDNARLRHSLVNLKYGIISIRRSRIPVATWRRKPASCGKPSDQLLKTRRNWYSLCSTVSSMIFPARHALSSRSGTRSVESLLTSKS